MILLIIILILLVLVYFVRISNNNDLINNNAKTEEDMQAIKEGKRKQYKSKVFIILTIASILLLIAFILFDFTNIDYILMDYFSADFVTEQEFDKLFYFIPAFLLITNLIYTQVNIGDFILRYFKTKEEEMEIKINKDTIMGLLYKKKTTTDNNQTKTGN